MATKSGVAYVTDNIKINNKFVTMVLAPQPRILWLNKQLQKGWHKLNYNPETKTWTNKLLRAVK